MSFKSEKAPGFKAEAIDVFETSDLPEADQHLLTSGLDLETGDTVEILPIEATNPEIIQPDRKEPERKPHNATCHDM